MEVANLCQPEGWSRWNRGTEEQRRPRWRGMRWKREDMGEGIAGEDDDGEESEVGSGEESEIPGVDELAAKMVEEESYEVMDEGVEPEVADDEQEENDDEGAKSKDRIGEIVDGSASEDEVAKEEEESTQEKEEEELKGDNSDHQEAERTQQPHFSEVSVKEEAGEGSGLEEKIEQDASEYDFFDGRNKMLEEEEDQSTDDEIAEDSTEDEGYDESVQTLYRKDDHASELFLTLSEFRELSLLTDLSLITKDGATMCVHAPVLAAVSSLVREALCDLDVRHDRKVVQRSIRLEVDQDGLEAIVEFAYTGRISNLNNRTVGDIKAAAETLGVKRVVDLCAGESWVSNTNKQQTDDGVSRVQQINISLQAIQQLQEEKVGCDVILEVPGTSFHVHRVILAGGSDYFRGMFSLGMRESLQPRIHLPFIPAAELKVLIGASYTGSILLSWSCVFEVTCLSLQLQLQPALSLSLKYLQEELNPHSCLDVASFAEAYQMTHLLGLADDYVLRQFPNVSRTAKFKDLPAKQLLRYLRSSSLYVPCELVVFRAVANWIQTKPKRRFHLAKQLMKTIHFCLMSFKEFKEVRSLKMWSDRRLADIYEAVHDEFWSETTSQCRVYLPKEILVMCGGDQISEDMAVRNITGDVWFGNALMNQTGIKKAMEWRLLGEMPEPARFSHEVAVFKGQLYVFGGNKYYGIGDSLNSVYRYNPLENSWERLADMKEHRCTFSMVVLDGYMFAIGGNSYPDYLESVERYSPTSNSWSFTRPLNLPLGGHIARVLHGQIYVSGGMNNDVKCLASMILYQPDTGSTNLAHMSKPRAHHCMETLGDHLYVAGGFTADAGGTVVDQLDCEVYSPATDSWTAFTSLTVPHVGAGSAVLEGRFYVLGGYSREDYSERKIVHRYDPAIRRWENMGKTAGPNNDIRAAVLCLPAHVRL